MFILKAHVKSSQACSWMNVKAVGIRKQAFKIQKHLKPNILKIVIQMCRILNGWAMNYVLCTRQDIQNPDQYKGIQDGVYLSGFQILWQSRFSIAFKINITIRATFNHLNTGHVRYSDPAVPKFCSARICVSTFIRAFIRSIKTILKQKKIFIFLMGLEHILNHLNLS